MSSANRDLLRELKLAEPFTGVRADGGDGRSYKFQVIGRGEMAFVQLGDKALVFELLVGQGVIFAATLRRWDDRTRVTDEERDEIIGIASSYLADKGATDINIVR